jgi:hypothetical protein
MVGTRQHPVMGQMRIARHYIRFGHTAIVPGCPLRCSASIRGRY